jgi:acyl carrier protein
LNTKELVKNYILTELVKDKKQGNISDKDSLIESGIVDSLGIMKLIGFLEDKMSVQITDDELVPENFGSIEAIATLVDKKQSR